MRDIQRNLFTVAIADHIVVEHHAAHPGQLHAPGLHEAANTLLEPLGSVVDQMDSLLVQLTEDSETLLTMLRDSKEEQFEAALSQVPDRDSVEKLRVLARRDGGVPGYRDLPLKPQQPAAVSQQLVSGGSGAGDHTQARHHARRAGRARWRRRSSRAGR